MLIEGLSLDDAYENLIRKIAGSSLSDDKNISLKEAIDIDKKRQSLEKKISSLKTQIKNE